jgi:hypothetical protein
MILWRLVLAHLLADFTFQTNFIAAWKKRNVWGGILHSAMFLVIGTALCWGYLTDIWVIVGGELIIQGWMALILLSILHFVEDEWRVWTIQKFNSPDNFAFFVWDQVIHLILIFVFFPAQLGFKTDETWVVLAILFVLTTHFTTIFVYYIEKDIFNRTDALADDKYVFMAERLLIAVCFLLPGWWAFSFLGVWALRTLVTRMFKKMPATSWTNILIGNGMAVLFGLFARLIY